MNFTELLESNAWNFFWGLAAFIVFVLIIGRIGVRQILTAVQAREEKIAREMKEAEDAYARARKVQADVDAKFAAAEGRIAELMNQARAAAEGHRTELVEKGRQEIEAMRSRALVDIEAARHAALVSVRQQIADIAIEVSEKIVRERLDPARHEAMVGEALQAYVGAQGGR